jgi:hypothetical protein
MRSKSRITLAGRSRTLLAALIAVLAFGAGASASASAALPEFAIDGGGSWPIAAEGSQTTSAKITEPIEAHECSGVNSKAAITGAGKAVALTLELTNCRKPSGTECHTKGAEGEALSGTGSLVYTSKAKDEVGILLTLSSTEILCGAAVEKVQGSIIIPITPVNTQVENLLIPPITGNGEGKPTRTTYENEKGEVKTAKLEVNYGAGYKEAALEVGEELRLKVEEGKTFTTKALIPPENPEVVLGEGELFPVTIESSAPVKVKISDSIEPITCEGVKSSGSITGAKALSLTLELKECETHAGSKCNTTGSEAGLVILSASASPVYIKKAENQVGMLLTLNATAFTCGTKTVKARGTIVNPVTPINTITSELGLAFTGNGEGTPTYTGYEGEKGEAETVKLEVNYGSGYKGGAFETGEKLELTANKSFTISG